MVLLLLQRVRVVARPGDGLGRGERGALCAVPSVRFFLEQRDLAREDVEPLLFRLCDKGALVERELRVVDEGVGCVIVFGRIISPLQKEVSGLFGRCIHNI